MTVVKKKTRKKSATRKPAAKKAKTKTPAKKKATRKATAKKATTKKSTTKKAAYGSGAAQAVEKEMHNFKRGKAKSGPKRKPVKSRAQAVAIGLSKARKKGVKVPKKKS